MRSATKIEASQLSRRLPIPPVHDEIGHDIAEHGRGAHEQRQPDHQRMVAVHRGRDDQASKARQRKDHLDADRADKGAAQPPAENRDQWQQRVDQG